MLYVSFKRSCFAVILVCAFTSGCVTRPVYEESWAEQVKVESDACPGIDGEYQNAGEQFYKAKNDTYERTTRSLAHLLNGGYDYEWHQADDRLGKTFYDPANDAYQTVGLRLEEGKLHIEASLADGSTKIFDLPTRQRCRDSTLVLETSWDGGTMSLLASAAFRETLALGRAKDGSLLVRATSTGGLFITWWPILAYTGAAWIRFPPVAPAPAQLSGLTP